MPDFLTWAVVRTLRPLVDALTNRRKGPGEEYLQIYSHRPRGRVSAGMAELPGFREHLRHVRCGNGWTFCRTNPRNSPPQRSL